MKILCDCIDRRQSSEAHDAFILSPAPDWRSFIPRAPSSDARPAEPMAMLNLLPNQRPQIKLPVNCDAFPLLYASYRRHPTCIECIFTLSFFCPNRVDWPSGTVFWSVPLENVLHSFRLQWKWCSLIRVYPEVPDSEENVCRCLAQNWEIAPRKTRLKPARLR